MQRISADCIVHSRTCFEQFKKDIDEIRQRQTIPTSVLLKLEKQCCTCGRQESKIHFNEKNNNKSSWYFLSKENQ